jgi:hypothetical protein
MTAELSPILGTEKAAPARAAKSEDSVVRQTRHSNRTGFDRRLHRRQAEIMIRKATRSTARVRGTGFGRRPLSEVAA